MLPSQSFAYANPKDSEALLSGWMQFWSHFRMEDLS